MNSNFDNPYNPGDICKIKSVFLHDPLHDAFTSAEMRFNQLCLHPDFVADRNDRDARRRAKSGRPCVVLDKNLMDGSCTIALFCTFEGDDINLVSSIYRCYSLSVFPTFRVPSCPEGEYALDLDTKPLHTTPEWKLPPRKDNPTELKDQWVLTLPLQVSKQDLNKLRPWPGSVALDPIELARFRKICHKVGDLFVERFKSPAELTMASQSVMTDINSQRSMAILRRLYTPAESGHPSSSTPDALFPSIDSVPPSVPPVILPPSTSIDSALPSIRPPSIDSNPPPSNNSNPPPSTPASDHDKSFFTRLLSRFGWA